MGDEARGAPRRRHQRRRRPVPWDVGCGLFGWYRQLDAGQVGLVAWNRVARPAIDGRRRTSVMPRLAR